MKFPTLNKLPRQQGRIDRFYGYEHLDAVRTGAFYDMKNLSSDKFPLLSVRGERGVFQREKNGVRTELSFDAPVTHAAALSQGIAVATENSVYYRGKKVTDLSLTPGEKRRRIIPFGRNFFISPDCKYVEVGDGGIEKITHVTVENTCEKVSFSLVYADYTVFDVRVFTVNDVPPIDSTAKDWVDTSTGRLIHKHLTNGKWETKAEFFILLGSENIGRNISPDERILVRGFNGEQLEFTVVGAEQNKLLVTGNFVLFRDQTPMVTVTKMAPVLDFVVEHQNRLWGCRYGKNAAGNFVNEIYASVLGDPTKWFTFKGISTDAFVSSLGCAGEFTGAAVIGREIVFFKEESIIRVSGSNPGDYYINVTPGRGVRRGAEGSAVTLNEKIFYLSSAGVTVYDGALPYPISDEFQTTDFSEALAGAGDGKYYLRAKTGEEKGIFVYDTKTGLWHVEDDPGVTAFVNFASRLLFFVPRGETPLIYDVLTPGAALQEQNIFGEEETGLSFSFTPQAPVSWFAETGFLSGTGGSFICRNIVLRLEMEEGAEFTLEIRTQRDKKWTKLCHIRRERKDTFSVPLNTPRSPGFCLRLSGSGGSTLHSIGIISEKTGEVNFYGK